MKKSHLLIFIRNSGNKGKRVIENILCYIDILCRSWTASTKANGLKQAGDGPGYKLLDFAKRLTTVI